MSGPPVMLMSTPRAPFIDTSSSSGLEIAASAASIARRSPSASPVPIIALPISLITARMSAKSRLIKPGITIRSVTPRTPACNTSSAILNASAKVVRSLATRNRFWFGMMSNVSTYLVISAMPFSAVFIRCVPSKWKGLVTTPTVRMPASRGPGDDRRRAGAGAAAHAGSDEHHVGALERHHDLVERFFGGDLADIGPRPGAEAACDGDAELNAALGQRLLHRLGVGVADDELATHE